MANFTPQQIEEFLQEFFDVVGTRQYTGARYVPIFGRAGSDTVEWDDLAPYEPLTVVMHQGVSYVSRRYVPTGIPITDTDYWVETYRFNAQVEQYRQEVLGFADDIADRVPFPDDDFYPRYGTTGQVLTTLANGSTMWADPVTPSDEQAEAVITQWLDDHPEATTTVLDGAITTPKLHDGAVTQPKLSDGLASIVNEAHTGAANTQFPGLSLLVAANAEHPSSSDVVPLNVPLGDSIDVRMTQTGTRSWRYTFYYGDGTSTSGAYRTVQSFNQVITAPKAMVGISLDVQTGTEESLFTLTMAQSALAKGMIADVADNKAKVTELVRTASNDAFPAMKFVAPADTVVTAATNRIYVNFLAGTTFKLHMTQSGTREWKFTFYYADGSTSISALRTTQTFNHAVTSPGDIVAIGVDVTSGDEESSFTFDFVQTPLSILAYDQLMRPKVLDGARVCFFGDSITYYYNWQPYVLEELGGEGFNCGVGSAPLAGDYPTAFWKSDRLDTVKDTNASLVTILGGANDLSHDTPIGTDADIASKNTATFLGAYSYIIDNLKTWKPSLKIVIMTTTWARNNGTDRSSVMTYDMYADACVKIARHYQLPLVDLYYQAGFNKYTMNDSPYNIYSADRIHPNTAGAKVIAAMLIAKIREIYGVR